MAVIPDSKDIAPGAKPWARWHDQQAQDNADAVTRLTQSTKNSLASTAASINLLSNQVATLNAAVTKLSSFTTTTATGTGGVTTSLGTTTWSSTGATVISTYTRTSSIVQITVAAAWSGLATVTSSGVAQSLGRLYLQIDGGFAQSSSGYAYTNNGSANTIGGSAYLTVTNTVVLAAGTHTFFAYGEGAITGTSGQTQVSAINLTVNVIG